MVSRCTSWMRAVHRVRHAEMDIVGGYEFADAAAALAGQRDDAHLALVRGVDRARSRCPSCRTSRSRAGTSPAAPSARTCLANDLRRSRSRWRPRSGSRCRWRARSPAAPAARARSGRPSRPRNAARRPPSRRCRRRGSCRRRAGSRSSRRRPRAMCGVMTSTAASLSCALSAKCARMRCVRVHRKRL